NVSRNPKVEALLNRELLTYQKVECLKIGPLDNARPAIATAGRGCSSERGGIDPAIRTFRCKQHWSTDIIRPPSTNRSITSDGKVRPTLVARNTADLPSGKDSATDTLHVSKEWNAIVIRGDEDIASIETRGTVI